jgi:hypothetical protein
VVTFALRLLYLPVLITDGRLSGAQRDCRRGEGVLALPGIETRSLGSAATSPDTVPTRQSPVTPP